MGGFNFLSTLLKLWSNGVTPTSITNVLSSVLQGDVEDKEDKFVVTAENINEALRKLMFLKELKSSSITDETITAVKSFEYEFSKNSSLSHINKGRLTEITGVISNNLIEVIQDAIDSPEIVKLSKTKNYKEKNKSLVNSINNYTNESFPLPLMMAILKQETGLNWYRKDGYPLIGLDYNNSQHPYLITSRGFFFSQRTLFKYPITVDQFSKIDDLNEDMGFFCDHLVKTFEDKIISTNPKLNDDLRELAVGKAPLRKCIFDSDSDRYMKDCRNCVWNSKLRDYKSGESVLNIPGKWVMEPTKYHDEKEYLNFPDYVCFPCDYLFAIRRYNGSGINSFHYLMDVLKILNESGK